MNYLRTFNESTNFDDLEKVEDLFVLVMDKWGLNDENQINGNAVNLDRTLLKMNQSSRTDQLAWSLFTCDNNYIYIDIYYHKSYDNKPLWNDFRDFYDRLKRINYNPTEIRESCKCYFSYIKYMRIVI